MLRNVDLHGHLRGHLDLCDGIEIAYGVGPYPDGLVFLPRQAAERLAALSRAVMSHTWGELRSTSSSEVYEQVLCASGHGTFDAFASSLDFGGAVRESWDAAHQRYLERFGEEEPSGSDRFDLASIATYCDGEFLPDVRSLMCRLLPEAIIEPYWPGESLFDDEYFTFPADREIEVVNLFTLYGYRCAKAQDLIDTILRVRWGTRPSGPKDAEGQAGH